MRYIHDLYESLQFLEAKGDKQRLIDTVGEDLANKFFENRKRFPAPYNDLYYWVKRTPQELEDYINNFASIKDTKEEGIEVLYKDDTWFVAKILTHDAATKYGANTKWCICGSNSYSKSGKTGYDYFHDYVDNGVEIIFYINKKQNKKYAMCALIPQGYCQIYDELNYTVPEIPNKPSAPSLRILDRLDRVITEVVYKDETFTVEKVTNLQFAGHYLIENNLDTLDGYQYEPRRDIFMTPDMNHISSFEFKRISPAHRKLYNDYLIDIH